MMRLLTLGDVGPTLVQRHLLTYETQTIIVRKHPIALLPPTATLAGSLIVAISTPVISHGRHLTVIIVWSLTAMLALELCLAVVRWRKTFLAITNHRLLICSGRCPNNVDIQPLGGLQGATIHQSFSSRIFGYGSLVHEKRPIFTFLPYPEQINLELQELLYPSPAPEE